MSVTLRVVGANGQALGDQAAKVFAASGGTIGRAPANDWVLPDTERFISSQHAAIENRGDGFYLVDNSINGTYINAAEQPVGYGNSQLLKEGDRIRIGEYDIVVSLASDSPGPVWPDEPSGSDQDLLGEPPPIWANDSGLGILDGDESVDPLDHFGPGAADTPAPGAWKERAAPATSQPLDVPSFGSFKPPNAIPDPHKSDPFTPDPIMPGSLDQKSAPEARSHIPADFNLEPHADQGIPADFHAQSAPPPSLPPTKLGESAATPAADDGIPEDWDRTTMPAMPDRARSGPPSRAAPAREPHPAAGERKGSSALQADPFAPSDPPPPTSGSPLRKPGAAPSTARDPLLEQPSPVQPAQDRPPGRAQRAPTGALPPSHPANPPPAASAPAPSSASTGDSGMEQMLLSAGLDAATARALSTPEMGEVFGVMLRIIVQGMMDVLGARAQIKNQFRVPMTQIKAVENNPLKFCIDPSDAMHKLTAREGQGFLGPIQAFDEAFDDVKAHQMAMMAGMRAAFDQLMQRFDPKNLQQEFDRDLRRSRMFQPLNKNKYWDMLSEMYNDLNRDSDANFSRLFGDEFARAYEEQMQRLSDLSRRDVR